MVPSFDIDLLIFWDRLRATERLGAGRGPGSKELQTGKEKSASQE